jgi:ubiquinone/menaquinone biosynthesis C-methylase UbiE
MEHDERVRREFARQADRFGSAAATTDGALTRRFVDALGSDRAGVILDVACGPGIVSAALAPEARAVVAFDITPAMLGNARRRCAAAGLDNVTFIEGSATALPFPAETFDAVATRLSIHHFKEPRRVVAEVRRVLRPGGTFVAADIVSADDPEKSALQNAIEVLRDPSHVRMLPVAELSSLVRDAGFALETEESWDQPRELEEWLAIVDDPVRVAPLRTMVRALAGAGQDAGIGLSLAAGAIVFFHRWHLIAARKPGARRAASLER